MIPATLVQNEVRNTINYVGDQEYTRIRQEEMKEMTSSSLSQCVKSMKKFGRINEKEKMDRESRMKIRQYLTNLGCRGSLSPP